MSETKVVALIRVNNITALESLFITYFVVLRMRPRAFHKHTTTELHPQPDNRILKLKEFLETILLNLLILGERKVLRRK